MRKLPEHSWLLEHLAREEMIGQHAQIYNWTSIRTFGQMRQSDEPMIAFFD